MAPASPHPDGLTRHRPAAGATPPWCRVLVVEQGSGLWGAQRYLLRLAPLLRAQGVEQILAAPAGSEIAQRWRAAGWPAVDLPVPAGRSVRTAAGRLSPGRALREAGRIAVNAGRIARLARRLDADVVHANSHWAHLEVVAGTRLRRRRAVLHLHERSEPDLIGRLRAIAVRGAEASVGVSAAVASSLGGRAARRVRVIRNGVDPQVFQPGPPVPRLRRLLCADPAAPVVIVVARLEPRKGVPDVIRALADLPAALDRAQLAVVGDSPDPGYADELRALAGRLLGDRARFLGARSDVSALLPAADLLVLASESEGLGLCVLEAQSCGLPVVAYPAGGVAELIEPERTGLLAAQGDVASLATQISRVLADPGLAGRLGGAARAAVLDHGTLAAQAAAQVALLRELVR